MYIKKIIIIGLLVNLLNSFVQALNYKVFINEILPSPKGPDEKEEFIEIFNANDFELDLTGWKISDKVGKTKTYIFLKGTKISAKSYLILNRPTTKITLNNDGDELILSDSSGEIVDQVSYQKAQEGKSYSKTDSGWIWTSNLTPGKENFNLSQVSNKKESENSLIEKEEFKAAIPKSSQSLIIFLISLSFAIFSAIVFLILKRRLIKEDKP